MNTKTILCLIFFISISYPLTPISDCAVLNVPNEYYVLQRNIRGPDCIKITEENITLNLNGYNVQGYGGYAIVINGTSGVLVENGTANSINGGIYVSDSQDSTIRNVAASTVSMYTIYATNSQNISFIGVNYSKGCGYAGTALSLSNTTYSTVEDSRCTQACSHNIEYDQWSSCVNLVSGSENNVIQNNYFYDAYRNGIGVDQSNNNTISGNTVEHSHWYGIGVVESENNTITGNRFIDSGLVHIYFEASGRNNNYTGNENEDGDPILVFIDQQDLLLENNQTSEIVLFNIKNATFRNITMVKGGINILGNGTANITFDGFEIRNAGAAIFMLPEHESIDILNGRIVDSTYGFYGTLDRGVYVENLNGTNIARYPIGLDIPSSGCGELSVSNYTVDENEVVYTDSGGFTPPSGNYSQVFMCGVSTASILDCMITHALFSYYSNDIDARRITIQGAYIPVKVLNSDTTYFEDLAVNNARVEGMNIQNSNNTYIYRTNITTVPDTSIPTFDLVDYRTYNNVGVYTNNVDGFVLNESRVENAEASVWMRGYSQSISIYGSAFGTGLDGVRIDNVLYGNIETSVFSDFSKSGVTVSYANQTEVKYNNLSNSGWDINNGAINFYGGRGIYVYGNRINARSGIIFTSYRVGSPDYLTKFYVYENRIENIPASAGVYVVASNYGSTTNFEITDNNISDALNGIRLLNAKNGTICRNRIADSTYGVYAIDSGELFFCDSEIENVTNFPIFTDYGTAEFCGSTNISNVTHENEDVEYYNTAGVVIENITDRAQIILCNVNDSLIRNIEMQGSEGERGILAVLSNRNGFYENYGNGAYSMAYLLRSNENNISNCTISNAQVGVMVDISSLNTIENSKISGTSGDAVKVYRNSHNNTVRGVNATGQPIVIDNGGVYTPESNVVYGNRINSTQINVYGSIYTAVYDNVIHDGAVHMYETTSMNTSYNNFTGICPSSWCIYCRGYTNMVYKNLFELDAQPNYGIFVVGTTNNISRNYFADTIVRVETGNSGCGNLFGIVNVSGPTDVTNRSCFAGNISEVEIIPDPVYESSNASCRVFYTHEDPYDADDVEFRWYVNGVYISAYDGHNSGARNSWIETNVSLPANESNAGDNITCEARAYDGTYWSEWVNRTTEVVADTCGVYINETSVDFGSLTTNVISAEKSVRVTNPGTAPGNFSINGTNWMGPAVFSSTRTRWSTASGSYESKTPINSTPVLVYENLGGGSYFNLYLQLYTPIGQENGTYNQTISMIAECP